MRQSINPIMQLISLKITLISRKVIVVSSFRIAGRVTDCGFEATPQHTKRQRLPVTGPDLLVDRLRLEVSCRENRDRALETTAELSVR